MDALALIVAVAALVIAIRCDRRKVDSLTVVNMSGVDEDAARDIAQHVVDRHEQIKHRS